MGRTSPAILPIVHSRTHDYGYLIRRWRQVCRARGLRIQPYTTADGYELFQVVSRRPDPSRPWLYLSAGIHGDEPAATEACLEWMATTRVAPSELNVMIFPCLNPWGLVHNQRTSAAGIDLNRTYHDDSVPQTAAHKAMLTGHRFRTAIALHEDYDANGVYIYELQGPRPFWAEELRAVAARHLPIDNRPTIEGRSCRDGIVRRKFKPGMMLAHPEAFVLFFNHTDRTLTIETPSEAHIDARIAAHVAMVERATNLCLDQPIR